MVASPGCCLLRSKLYACRSLCMSEPVSISARTWFLLNNATQEAAYNGVLLTGCAISMSTGHPVFYGCTSLRLTLVFDMEYHESVDSYLGLVRQHMLQPSPDGAHTSRLTRTLKTQTGAQANPDTSSHPQVVEQHLEMPLGLADCISEPPPTRFAVPPAHQSYTYSHLPATPAPLCVVNCWLQQAPLSGDTNAHARHAGP